MKKKVQVWSSADASVQSKDGRIGLGLVELATMLVGDSCGQALHQVGVLVRDGL
jgi:hypothetical protein